MCLLHLCTIVAQEAASSFRIAELNCENLFDTLHDEGFQDKEFLPSSERKWTSRRYRRKLLMLSKEIASISPTTPPDVIALIEVENDTVLRDLTQHTPLRSLRYKYVMTHSDDPRGIDVALLYQEGGFRPLRTATVNWSHRLNLPNLRTRDLLHVRGLAKSGDTIDIMCASRPKQAWRQKSTKTSQRHIEELEGVCRLHLYSQHHRQHNNNRRLQRHTHKQKYKNLSQCCRL